jgi:hypothetical protein
MVEVVQDGERFLPGGAGLIRLTGSEAGVADVAERLGLGPAVADLPVQAEGPLVTGGRFGVVAELVVGEPEAVPDVGLQPGVATFLEQLERLPAGGARLPVVAELDMEPADPVEGEGLARPVAGRGEQLERLPGMAEGVGVAALLLEHDAE